MNRTVKALLYVWQPGRHGSRRQRPLSAMTHETTCRRDFDVLLMSSFAPARRRAAGWFHLLATVRGRSQELLSKLLSACRSVKDGLPSVCPRFALLALERSPSALLRAVCSASNPPSSSGAPIMRANRIISLPRWPQVPNFEENRSEVDRIPSRIFFSVMKYQVNTEQDSRPFDAIHLQLLSCRIIGAPQPSST